MAEQRFCKPQVVGSNPTGGFALCPEKPASFSGFPGVFASRAPRVFRPTESSGSASRPSINAQQGAEGGDQGVDRAGLPGLIRAFNDDKAFAAGNDFEGAEPLEVEGLKPDDTEGGSIGGIGWHGQVSFAGDLPALRHLRWCAKVIFGGVIWRSRAF